MGRDREISAGTILTIVLVAGIIGIALTLIIVGVSKKSDEFIFMEGCYEWETSVTGLWRISKLSKFLEFDVCEEPIIEQWDAKLIPLKVYEGTKAEETKFSVDWLNTSLGFRLFALEEKAEKSNVFIRLNVPHGFWDAGSIDANGATYHRKVNGNLFSDIYVSNVVAPNELAAVLVHELGHVVFLGHDEVEESFMHYPTLTMERIRVRDSDKGALRSLYTKTD